MISNYCSSNLDMTKIISRHNQRQRKVVNRKYNIYGRSVSVLIGRNHVDDWVIKISFKLYLSWILATPVITYTPLSVMPLSNVISIISIYRFFSLLTQLGTVLWYVSRSICVLVGALKLRGNERTREKTCFVSVYFLGRCIALQHQERKLFFPPF